MTEQNICEFVVLAYASDPVQEEPSPMAVVARVIGPNGGGPLIIHVAAVAEAIANTRHLQYLHELFESWRGMTGSDLNPLFSEIRELSSGPLRSQRIGSCLLRDLPTVVEGVLGASIDLRRASSAS